MKLSVTIKKKLGDFLLDVSFEFSEGVFALLGASGCGKSMTLKCIAGIERPDAGRIVLGDHVLFDSEKKIDLPPQRRRVGYMFQDYALFPNMTVRQNVAVGVAGRNAGEKKRKDKDAAGRVDDLLCRFHVEELGDHYPAQLSGGQKQRVAMARLMGQEPDVILLDEPFSALDSHLKWQLEQEMREALAQTSRPVIFVSHDRDEVFHIADTVCCINAGDVETIQPVREFFASPQTRAAALLSGCKNVAAVERVDAHHLRCPAWGIELAVEKEIPEDIRYAGIRAHALIPVGGAGEAAAALSQPDGIPVSFAPCDVTVQEDPFEWTVFFRATPGAPEKLQWKTSKVAGQPLTVPERFAIDPSRVMLLR